MTTDVDEHQIISDFVTIDRSSDAAAIVAVAKVVWDGPHRPVLQWRQYDRTFGAEMTDEDIVRVVSGDSRFFRTCERCGEVRSVGHMHSESICQGCAQGTLEVAY